VWKIPLTYSSPEDLEGEGTKRTETGPFEERRFIWTKLHTDITSGELIEKDDVVVGIAMAETIMGDYSWIQTYGFHPRVKYSETVMPMILKVA